MLEYKATSIGSGKSIVQEILEEEYNDSINFEESLILGLKALNKVANDKLNPSTIEGSFITIEEGIFKSIDEKIIIKHFEKITNNSKKSE